MGGHAGGEVASNLALVTLQEALKTIKKNNVKNNENTSNNDELFM